MNKLKPNFAQSFQADFQPHAFSIQEFRQSKLQRMTFQKRILRGLRGPLTAARLSARLGFTFNQYSKWESAKVRLSWKDFCTICESKKIDLSKALTNSYLFHFSEIKNIPDEFLRFTFSTYFLSDANFMASYLGIAAHKLRRWFKDPGSIPFEEVLKIMIFRVQFFIEFLRQLELLEEFPEFAVDQNKIENLIEIESNLPFMSAVLYFLDCESYKNQLTHSNDFISQSLHLEKSQVEAALKNLEKLEVIKKEDGKYLPLNLSFDLHGSSKQKQVLEFNYWIYRWLCHLQLKQDPNTQKITSDSVSAFRIFTIPEENVSKVSEVLRRSYHEILSLIKESPPGQEKLRVFMLGHFGVEDSPRYEFISDVNQGFKEEKIQDAES